MTNEPNTFDVNFVFDLVQRPTLEEELHMEKEIRAIRESDDIEELIREVIGLARLELEVLKSVSISKEKKDNLERAIQQKRSNEVKFEIIKDYVSDIPTKEIEEKHDIKSVHSRVRKFREQLVLDKDEKWKSDEKGMLR